MSRGEEQELRRLLVELQILEGTVGSLQSRIGLVEAALRELSMTSSTLEGLKEEEKGSRILVPIGGGSYVRASVEDSEKIVFGIGA
ncbi:MAG: prefoldin subunit alpha, partial [Candidatus Bathyarchaeia archaeon]